MRARDDLGGVGTFSRENTTLYIGGLHVRAASEAKAASSGSSDSGSELERGIRRHFGQFGALRSVFARAPLSLGLCCRSVRVVAAKKVAFVEVPGQTRQFQLVQFALRSAAEFAKACRSTLGDLTGAGCHGAPSTRRQGSAQRAVGPGQPASQGGHHPASMSQPAARRLLNSRQRSSRA